MREILLAVFTEDKLRQLEAEAAALDHITRLSQIILAELTRATPPLPHLEEVHRTLRSAREQLGRGQAADAERLAEQAAVGLVQARRLLAVSDLGITPFALRIHAEKQSLGRELEATLIRYFLAKKPHAENDRDKLDYILTAHFLSHSDLPPAQQAAELERACAELTAGVEAAPLRPSDEVMRHELESLIAHVDDFHNFDQLVQARMIERVRALKTNLGEAFYHPRVLPTLIRFNLAFRQRFDTLFDGQIQGVREAGRRHLEEAWEIVRQIEAAYEALAFPEGGERLGGPIVPEGGGEAPLRFGRPLTTLAERLPLDHLVRPGEPGGREQDGELRGIVGRLARFVAKLPPEQVAAEKVVFPLRHAQLELVRWEREAFLPASVAAAPQSVGAIQLALGAVAWMEEELAQYNENRRQRYLWKPHFDALSRAVARAVEVLRSVRDHMRPEAPEEEAAWFGPLLHTAVRVGISLNHVAPAFEDSA